MNKNIYEEIKLIDGIDKEKLQHTIKIIRKAFHKIVKLFNKISETLSVFSYNSKKSDYSMELNSYEDNFLTSKEINIYGLVRPSRKEIFKARKLYDKLQISNIINFKQFYMCWGAEIQKLNINKIDCLDKLTAKIKGYQRYRRKLMRKGKLKRCINCCMRTHSGHCITKPILNNKEELDYCARVHDNYKCYLWHSKYPEHKAKEFVTRVFNDLNKGN